ncbi:MAG TPA: UvrD-helicase domain-containing protein, partial [Verrucomicrobiae bacterium]|nr:UvrD-helicase domain-containing protein [Verrucomicrobiae bacterium]
MSMHWSAAKERLFAFESDIAVCAGAGSGKTAALVELYLRLLAGETAVGQVAPAEIAAITFTDKAATEMEERIRRGMEARLQAEPHLPWEEHLRQLPEATISTFHSFCARLLREFP